MGKLGPIYTPQTQSEQTYGAPTPTTSGLSTELWYMGSVPSDSQDQGNTT